MVGKHNETPAVFANGMEREAFAPALAQERHDAAVHGYARG